MMLRFLRFDNKSTRAERVKTDKAAPIRDIWIMLKRNLEKAYKPYERITTDKQLFKILLFLNNYFHIEVILNLQQTT